jgi:hypothetical protein
MGTPAWITIEFGLQFGVCLYWGRWNSGLSIRLSLPFISIFLNTDTDKYCKKEIIEFI